MNILSVVIWIMLLLIFYLTYKTWSNIDESTHKKGPLDWVFLLFLPKEHFNEKGIYYRRILNYLSLLLLLLAMAVLYIDGLPW